LVEAGYSPGENDLLDLYCELPTGPALYEVKSITDENWRDQVRKGVAQLKEYRFLHGLAEASLYLVLSGPPAEAWVLDLLVKEFGVGVLWADGKDFSGPSARAALGGPQGVTPKDDCASAWETRDVTTCTRW
jgi:hypothetical protein